VLYRVEQVAVTFAGRTVLRDVTLQHNPGEKLILLGRNGSGKTTLLRVIGGEQEASAGTVERARDLEIAGVEQLRAAGAAATVLDACLDAIPGLRALEAELETLSSHCHPAGEADAARLHELHEAYARLDGYRARPRVGSALDAIGLPRGLHGRPLGQLSGGERTRVALVRALLSPAPLLLLDEPTNHLDLVGVEFLARELAARDRRAAGHSRPRAGRPGRRRNPRAARRPPRALPGRVRALPARARGSPGHLAQGVAAATGRDRPAGGVHQAEHCRPEHPAGAGEAEAA
jgi:ATP-binding cassette subfamily F protein 3